MTIPIRIASMGPADHGKSTLFGMLVLHHIDSDTYWHKINKYEKECDWYRPDRSFTYMFDRSIDERIGHLGRDGGHNFSGASMFPSHVQCDIAGKKYLFIDLPGHDKFIKSATRGIFQAQTCILVISAIDIEEVVQTFIEKESSITKSNYSSNRRGDKIANALMCPILSRAYGIKNIILVISKMDCVYFKPYYFQLGLDELVPRLINYSGLSKNKITVLPTSINVFDRSDTNVITPVAPDHEMSWYKGTTLLNTIMKLEPLEPIRGPLLIPVETVFLKQVRSAPLILTGRIMRGQVSEGQMVQVIPLYDRSTALDRPKKIRGRVKSIRHRGESQELPWIGKFGSDAEKQTEAFEAGHVVGLNLHLIHKYSWAKRDERCFKKGCIVTAPDDKIIMGNIIHAEVFVPVFNRPFSPSECWIVFLFGKNKGEAFILSSSFKEGPFVAEAGDGYTGYLAEVKLLLNSTMAYPESAHDTEIYLRDIVIRHHDSFCGGRVLDLFFPEKVEASWEKNHPQLKKPEIDELIADFSETSKTSCDLVFRQDDNKKYKLILTNPTAIDIKIFFKKLEKYSPNLSSVKISAHAKR